MDRMEAEAVLSYDCTLNHLIGVDQLQQLCDPVGVHQIRFVHIKQQCFLDKVFLHNPITQDDQTICIDVSTYFQLKWKANGVDRQLSTYGKINSNIYGTDCNLLFQIYGPQKMYLEPYNEVTLATNWRDEHSAQLHKLNMQVMVNDADIQCQVHAVHNETAYCTAYYQLTRRGGLLASEWRTRVCKTYDSAV